MLATSRATTAASYSAPGSATAAAAAPAKPEPANAFRRASEDLLSIVLTNFTERDGQVHAESAVSAAAALAAQQALRAAERSGAADATEAGRQAFDLLVGNGDDPTAWWMIARAARVAGLSAAELPDPGRIFARGRADRQSLAAQPAGMSAPASPPGSLGRVRLGVESVAFRHRLAGDEVATMLGWAIGMVIAKTRKSSSPAALATLAADAMFGALASPPARPQLTLVRS